MLAIVTVSIEAAARQSASSIPLFGRQTRKHKIETFPRRAGLGLPPLMPARYIVSTEMLARQSAQSVSQYGHQTLKIQN